MNGRQLADLAQLSRPELKVLFATGYAEGANASDYLAPNMEIITKPFAIDALANKIREMLSHPVQPEQCSGLHPFNLLSNLG